MKLMKKIRRCAAGLLALLMMVALIGTQNLVLTAEAANGPDICGPAYVVMNAKTGELICEKNSSVAYYPASITKIMTALVVYENITSDQLDDVITFSYDAAVTNINLRSSTLKPAAKEGEQMTVNDALHGMILPSGNECANALAEYVAGSNEAFVEMMNQKLADLGLEGSHFMNPSGLDDDNQYVTCYDMAHIMQAAIQIPELKELLSCQSYTIPATNLCEARSLTAGHGYVSGEYAYEGSICGKGGKTVLAKRTLVTCVDQEDFELIAVVLCDEESRAYQDTQTILDFSFSYLRGEVEEVNWESKGEEIWPITTAILYEYTDTCNEPVAELDSNTKVTCIGKWDKWYAVSYNGITCFGLVDEWTNGEVIEATPTPTPKPTNPFYEDVDEKGDTEETAAYEKASREEEKNYLTIVGTDTTPKGPFAVMWLFIAAGTAAGLAGLATVGSLLISARKNRKRRKLRGR